ncbi:hypothetical protein PR202_gb23938 [Eleusine coracana subsp. coracana]|uniref:Uncharacterized protein n=1 Tax=Eleusine coracana subsp. coracana TaxID=191504 RepID=A0AAV5FLN9_ELECO|nr:hypothetical protein PR202_gb23926 [Eleusine coracana subsp. coracana]GJN35191.1 hypothetical protein PR202_gb23938 [Eleusine coracana subsp. coracana]
MAAACPPPGSPPSRENPPPPSSPYCAALPSPLPLEICSKAPSLRAPDTTPTDGPSAIFTMAAATPPTGSSPGRELPTALQPRRAVPSPGAGGKLVPHGGSPNFTPTPGGGSPTRAGTPAGAGAKHEREQQTDQLQLNFSCALPHQMKWLPKG